MNVAANPSSGTCTSATADEVVEYLERTCAPMAIPPEAMEQAVKRLADQIDAEMMALERREA